ncbi:MAG: hypothetical protein A3A51_04225 [Candidatus Levybacteria bacterium RIFCSPLOWO2_01_FULL_39_10]|nr:MAG: hypothetical protein A3A51_04225 [Candidatus Levybacteria bacterium RIFCSPLOWO2_01_FULL_39_10]
MKKTYSIIRLLRPRQWIKNFAIFASVVFTGELFNPLAVNPVIIGFFAFCAASSASYIINDFFDVKKDRLHPTKKYRPLAHGDLDIRLALILALSLIFVSLWLSFLINISFVFLILIYLFIQFFYSKLLKGIAVIDILTIALGYILRVIAGEVASGYHLPVWLILTTISISLFLALGKRRSELTLLSKTKGENISSIRASLSHYSDNLLNVYIAIFATATFISYSLFTFLENPKGILISFWGVIPPELLPGFFQRKWLMITIIPVVYGLMRYLQDIYEKHEGESPEKVLFSDKPLLATVVVWAALVVLIIYFISP